MRTMPIWLRNLLALCIVVVFSAGDQICADAVVISGNIKVNEALLTGESDEIEKVGGSSLMSGSFVVSGQCCARLVNVGEEAYIYKLTKEAKEMGSGEQSEMVKSINQLLNVLHYGNCNYPNRTDSLLSKLLD